MSDDERQKALLDKLKQHGDAFMAKFGLTVDDVTKHKTRKKSKKKLRSNADIHEELEGSSKNLSKNANRTAKEESIQINLSQQDQVEPSIVVFDEKQYLTKSLTSSKDFKKFMVSIF